MMVHIGPTLYPRRVFAGQGQVHLNLRQNSGLGLTEQCPKVHTEQSGHSSIHVKPWKAVRACHKGEEGTVQKSDLLGVVMLTLIPGRYSSELSESRKDRDQARCRN